MDMSQADRRARLDRLANALRLMQPLPRSARTSGLSSDIWIAPGGARYVYLGENEASAGIIAFEPSNLGDERLVLLKDFSILSLTTRDIEKRLAEALR